MEACDQPILEDARYLRSFGIEMHFFFNQRCHSDRLWHLVRGDAEPLGPVGEALHHDAEHLFGRGIPVELVGVRE